MAFTGIEEDGVVDEKGKSDRGISSCILVVCFR